VSACSDFGNLSPLHVCVCSLGIKFHRAWRLKRFHESHQTHFITFTCYRRKRLLDSAEGKSMFELALERVRQDYRLCVYGYVVMPEHVHLLLSEPERSHLSQAVKALKQAVSRRLIGEAEAFWQKRYYDHNVRNYESFVGKLRYIHRNPVKRGLCARPEDWEWEQFPTLCNGGRRGRADRVAVDGESTREGRSCAECGEMPHSSKFGLSGPPANALCASDDPTLAPNCTARRWGTLERGGAPGAIVLSNKSFFPTIPRRS
jgi:putative transposase